MAQLIDSSKTLECENCEGTGIDPLDGTPDFVVERADGDPREGCPICHGFGFVQKVEVLLETDDLEKLVRAAHKAKTGTEIVGVDSTELPDIEAPTPKDAKPTLEERVAALEKSAAKG